MPQENEGLLINKTFQERLDQEQWSHLPPIKKNLYQEDISVAEMDPSEVKQFRAENFNMEVYQKDKIPIPNPCKTFEQAFKHYPEILEELAAQGFEKPSPIQSQSWPILLSGHDMVGIAQTGTGKTLAFILPAMINIEAQEIPRFERVGPSCLVLAPTRELAQQIEKEIRKYNYKGIRCICVYGQGDKRIQLDAIRSKVEIIVATPGRLNEFTEKGLVDLSGVTYLVLDEADRMLDMGFEPQIRKIVLDIRPDRQTVMTSATWPEEVRDLGEKLMKDPIHVVVGSLDLKAVHTVTQEILMCTEEDKFYILVKFIQTMDEKDKVIVFCGKKLMVDRLCVDLLEENIAALLKFNFGPKEKRSPEINIDGSQGGSNLAGPGSNLVSESAEMDKISHIVNYDCPRDMEEYVHRVGRTGRAGRSGQALTLVTRENWTNAGKLVDILEKSQQEIPAELYEMRDRWEKKKLERGDQRDNRSRFRRNGNNSGSKW
ncbi:unnamed protein product, partial [Meganyctiphanes norvegica]